MNFVFCVIIATSTCRLARIASSDTPQHVTLNYMRCAQNMCFSRSFGFSSLIESSDDCLVHVVCCAVHSCVHQGPSRVSAGVASFTVVSRFRCALFVRRWELAVVAAADLHVPVHVHVCTVAVCIVCDTVVRVGRGHRTHVAHA